MKQITPVTIAQVTDIHLFASVNQELMGIPTIESFCAVIKNLKRIESQLDLLLLTGDLSDDGTVESYENLQSLVSTLQIPTYWLPGNHDSAIAMQQVLNQRLISQRKSFERGGWNFILLDSSVPGCVDGHLSHETLTWLDSQLSIIDNKPTLISLHHPPLEINSGWLDTIKLQNSAALFSILDRHPKVKLVLFGHIHQEFHSQRYGVDYLATPSTCIQFTPNSPNFALDRQYPGFRLLKLYPNGTWESWVERVPFHSVELTVTG